MMSSAKIVVNSIADDRIAFQKYGSIWGNIYIEVDDMCFPSNTWYDVVSSIINMWADAIIDFGSESKKECDLYFMDGFYLLHLSKLNKDKISIVGRVDSSDVFKKSDVSFVLLAQSLLDCMNILTEKYYRLSINEKEELFTKHLAQIQTLSNLINAKKTGDGFVS